MRKKLILIVNLFLLTVSLLAQVRSSSLNLNSGNTEQKNAIFVDLFPSIEGVWEGKIGAGLFYERSIDCYFTFVGEANFYTDFENESAYSIIGHGRMYPFQTALGKVFADIGFGYRRSTLEKDNIHCLDISASAGWKFILTKGFIIEPNIGYRQNIYTIRGYESQKGGITLNLGLGWVF